MLLLFLLGACGLLLLLLLRQGFRLGLSWLYLSGRFLSLGGRGVNRVGLAVLLPRGILLDEL